MDNELSIDADKNEISLEDNKSDRAVVVLKGALGTVPVVGSMLSEVVGIVIPNQKTDRIKRFVEVFAEKVKYIEKDVLDLKLKTEKFTDLFEDALPQAARALTDERREYIANLLKNSLSSDQADHLKEKKLLSLLNELNDAEVIILKHTALIGNKRAEFNNLHRDLLRPNPPVISSPQHIKDNYNLIQSYKSKLEELGLTAHKFQTPRKGEEPEFDDKTGRLKSRNSIITQIGKLLLRYIDDDFSEN